MEMVCPKLRFKDKNGKEFGAWEEKKFGDIFSFYSTNCLSREYLVDDGGYIRNIHYGDIHTKYSTILNVYEEEIPYIKSDVDLSNIKGESYCKKGDLIIADTSEDYADVGKSIELINVDDEKILSGLHTFLCRDEKEVFVEKFKGYLMNSAYVHDQIRILASGTKVYGLNKYNLIKVNLPVPSLPEQQKIAAFLSKVDEKIALQSKKIEELEKLKRGFMQKIFARELRFKDENGKEFGAWEEKKFGDIFSIYSTNCLSREYLMDDGGYIRNIHYGDIHTKYSTILNVHEEEIPYIKSDVDLSKIKDESYCKKGDLIIADTSEDYADVGKSIELINVDDEKILSGLHTFLCRDEKGVFVEKFKGYLMNSPCIHDQIRILASGTKVYSLNKYNLITLSLPIPSLPEQKKIAEFLPKFDERIEVEAEILERWKKVKKGLLQQMFV